MIFKEIYWTVKKNKRNSGASSAQVRRNPVAMERLILLFFRVIRVFHSKP